MDTADAGAIEEFLDRYRHFTESLHSQYFEQFCTQFHLMRAGLEDVLAQAAVERRRTASTFNIFQVLDRTYDYDWPQCQDHKLPKLKWCR